MQNLVERHEEIKNYGLHEAFYLLARSIQINEESIAKATKVELARGLAKAGVSVDIISQATGLSTNEYNNIEEVRTDSADYTMGQRIKYWRLKRGYTQKDLANEVGVSQQQIQRYEKGDNDIPREKLHALARGLTVEIIALQPGPEKGENEDSEAGILGLMEECNKINNRGLLDTLDSSAWFLCGSMQVHKKEVIKVVKVEVA